MDENLMDSGKLVTLSQEDAEYAISSFQEILRIPTVSITSPDSGEYIKCSEYLLKELLSISLLQDVHMLPESPLNSPVIVAHWRGTQPDLPVILLNSHYDVVPADPDDWTVPPFDGIRKDGVIYGRGAQDMKCVCIQYIEAIRFLMKHNFTPTRSIYLTFVPDEEVSGSGMAALLKSNLYKHEIPGIALALDEGLASTDDTFSLFYGERLGWWVDVTAQGNTGHGSRFIENTAVEQLLMLANKALTFREEQRKLLFSNPSHENCAHAVAAAAAKKKTIGDVTSLNITTLQAGVQIGNRFAYNCVPSVAKCSFDIRISPHTPPSEIANMLDLWCQECKSGGPEASTEVSWKFVYGLDGDSESMEDNFRHAMTSTDKQVNPWFDVLLISFQKRGLKITPQVFPAATDSRFLRLLGIRAFGFSPMRNTEILLHENDESLSESTFLEGISVYIALIFDLASHAFPESMV
jgi:aminoacylase